MYWSSRAKLTNTADMIRSSATRRCTATTSAASSSGRRRRDRGAPPGTQGLHYELLFELYDNETEYTQDLYATVSG